MTPQLIAFYLPQFHPIPENDAWWGRGFTEWTNVVKARPLFWGHYQPHLPADLGFYDLRVSETRQAQAEMARQYGLGGFCYYHYWFGGRRLIERPFQEVLTSGRPDFPFCLCWANEPWSRRWLGEECDVLMPQQYSAADDNQHAQWLARTFCDSRYLRHEERPLFLVYRPKDHPDPVRFVEATRIASRARGLRDPYLVGVDAHCPGFDFRALGFDSTLCFAPQLGWLPRAFDDHFHWRRLRANLALGVCDGLTKVYCENELRMLHQKRLPVHLHIPSVFVGWDNTPRRGTAGIIVHGGGPASFGADLRQRLSSWRSRQPGVPWFFINAWNEWGEGNHLEPDQRHGHAYLQQVVAALRATTGGEHN